MDWVSLKRFGGTAEACGAIVRGCGYQRKDASGSRNENPETLF